MDAIYDCWLLGNFAKLSIVVGFAYALKVGRGVFQATNKRCIRGRYIPIVTHKFDSSHTHPSL